MPVVYEPKYILQIDELPKVIESDGVVYPIYLPAKDAARLFGVTLQTIMSWHRRYGFPLLRMGSPDSKFGARNFVEIAALNEFIKANSVPRRNQSDLRD